MSELPLQIVVLEPVVDSGLELLKVIGKSNQVEIIQTASSDEALQVVQQFLPCIFLISIRGSLDGAGNKGNKSDSSAQPKIAVAPKQKETKPTAKAA